MEIKLLQEFDYDDKCSLFGQMDNMNDAIVKEIRESGNSLYITLHQFDEFVNPKGEVMWPYKELEIEYDYAEKNHPKIYIYDSILRIVDLDGLLDWIKKEKAELEMNDWMITSGGVLLLKLISNSKNRRRKSKNTNVDIYLIPKKIIYRWM